MSAFLHGSGSCHGQQAHLSSHGGSQNHHAFSQLLFQLIAQIPQAVHVHAIHCGSQNLHAFYFRHLIGNVSQRFLSQFAL